MAGSIEPEIILYDLACTKKVCFSPVAWRIRIMLNYKRISYRTVFVEFPDIESTLQGLGLEPNESASGSGAKYTVPAIHHVPTNTYMMDSEPIARFLESTYPSPPVSLTSELGDEIRTKARTAIGPTFATSLMPREVDILSPRAQEYFRRTREAAFGRRLEDFLDLEREDQAWEAATEGLQAVEKLMRTHRADGPFVLGAQPSFTDFFIAGSLQFARVVDERVFERISKYAAFREIYEACLPFMEKKD